MPLMRSKNLTMSKRHVVAWSPLRVAVSAATAALQVASTALRPMPAAMYSGVHFVYCHADSFPIT